MFSWATKHSVSKSQRLDRNRSRKRRLLFEGLETRRVFAAYEVTTLQDIVAPNDGVISLREAIAMANETSVSDTVTFAASLMSAGDATIRLNGTELAITQPVEIIGPTSARLTIDADQKSRVFKIGDSDSSSSQEITISNLRLVNGRSTQGGAIYSTETLIIVGSTIENSSADMGGAIYTTNMLNIWESNLSRNRAAQSGGAIYAMSDLSVVDSTIALNSAAQNGGGIATILGEAKVVLVNATVMGNAAANGGGVSGPAVSIAMIANSIIAGNTANTAGAADIAGILPPRATHNVIGVAAIGWDNGYQNNVLGIDWKTIVENDGQLPILKNNGGRTETIAILRNGPAANKGSNDLFGDILTRNDQRGLPRLQGKRIDIGAIELPPIETITTVAASNRRYDGQAVSFSVEVRSKENTTVLPTGTVMLSFYVSADKTSLVHTGFITLENGKGHLLFSEQGYGIYRVETRYVGDVNFSASDAAALERTGPEVDYGDAPSSSQSGMASSYPVTFDDDGARHTNAFRGVILGRTISPSNEGIHSANSDADTSDDGVSWPFPIVSSSIVGVSSVWVENGGAVAGKLDAWIDFNRDGDWNDVGERIFNSDVINAGRHLMTFSVPAGAAIGATAARFRISLNGNLGPTGSAYDGEVEDYRVEIVSTDKASFGLSPETANLVTRIDVVNGMTVLESADGKTLFRTALNPAMEIALTPSTSRPFTINDLQLENAGSLSVRMETDRDIVKLLSATTDLIASLSPTARATNRLPEIDATHSSVNKITPRANLYRVRVLHGAEDTLDTSVYRLSAPIIVNGELMHRWVSGGVALEVVNPTPFHNPTNKYDVDYNGRLEAIDVLGVINALARDTSSKSVDLSKMDPTQWRYTDVNGDGKTTPIDVLILINELKRLSIPVPGLSGGILNLNISSGSVSAIGLGSANLTINAGQLTVSAGNDVYLAYVNVNRSLTLTQSGLNQLSNSIVFGDGTAVSGLLKKGSMEAAITPVYNDSLVRVVGRKIQIDSILPASVSGVFQTFPLGDASANHRTHVRTERPTSTTLQLTPIPGLTTLVSTSGNVSPITVVSSSGIGSQITISNSSPLSSGVLVIRGSVGNLSIP